MLQRRPTLYELYKPSAAEFVSSLAVEWGDGAILKLFEHVWTAYDGLSVSILQNIDWRGNIFDVERSISDCWNPASARR